MKAATEEWTEKQRKNILMEMKSENGKEAGPQHPPGSHQRPNSIGGRPVCDLQFADNTDLKGSSNGELQDFTNRFVDRVTAYGMEVSTENSKIITNSMSNISADISMNGQKLEASTWEQPCARMAPAQQKSASGFSQQWPD